MNLMKFENLSSSGTSSKFWGLVSDLFFIRLSIYFRLISFSRVFLSRICWLGYTDSGIFRLDICSIVTSRSRCTDCVALELSTRADSSRNSAFNRQSGLHKGQHRAIVTTFSLDILSFYYIFNIIIIKSQLFTLNFLTTLISHQITAQSYTGFGRRLVSPPRYC